MADSGDVDDLDIESIMSTRAGRAFVNRILIQTSQGDSVFDENPYVHAMNEGRRQLGVWLTNEIKRVAFDNYIKMMRENNEYEERSS